jgi:predicted SAM-dependent methyltransferase
MTRGGKILSAIRPHNQLGLEIGALNRPIIIPKMGRIRYVDHATTAELKIKYAKEANVDVSKIVEVDYIWGDKSLPELVQAEAPFDYVLASHVIEHVPDFIGWLKEVFGVLRPGGVLSLVIPDKRYCFDYHRRTSTVPELVGAYLQKQRKPTPRQIHEYWSMIANWEGRMVWDQKDNVEPGKILPYHSAVTAWESTQRIVQNGAYFDVHCWVFTPESFFQLLRNLIEIGLFDFKVVRFFPTAGCEFYVSLEALDTSADPTLLQKAQFASLPSGV